MRKVLWELPRNQQIAIVAAVLLIAFGAIAIYAFSGLQATDCITVKAELYKSWDNSLPLLTLQFEANVSESQALSFAQGTGLALRQSNTSAEGYQFHTLDAPEGKTDRIVRACQLEQSPLVKQAYLVRPLFKQEDGV